MNFGQKPIMDQWTFAFTVSNGIRIQWYSERFVSNVPSVHRMCIIFPNVIFLNYNPQEKCSIWSTDYIFTQDLYLLRLSHINEYKHPRLAHNKFIQDSLL